MSVGSSPTYPTRSLSSTSTRSNGPKKTRVCAPGSSLIRVTYRAVMSCQAALGEMTTSVHCSYWAGPPKLVHQLPLCWSYVASS